MPDTMAEYTQERRTLAMQSKLGEDNVLLMSVDGEDAISSPFCVAIEFATTLPVARVKQLLGQPVTIWFGGVEEHERRPLNGLVCNLSGPRPGPRNFRLWRAELAPRLAFLGFTADCRIFQNMTVPDILRAIFAAHGLADYEFRALMGHYRPLDYCVQYRETALAFVSRLMEHVGLFYWHEFAEGIHQLVITDSNLSARPALHAPARTREDGGLPDIETVFCDYAFRTGKWTLTDYDFTVPSKSLIANTPIMHAERAMQDYEFFDFPGLYTDVDDGKTLTRVRIEHEETRLQVLHGSAWRPEFDAGRTVAIEQRDADADGLPKRLLLTRVRHVGKERSFYTSNAEPASYNNEFDAIPADIPFRPERVTPVPVVKGTQCAVVVGPPGEQIYTDEHGRVKLRFFWDRNPAQAPDDQLSCWVRVSQAWADGKFGGVHLPRIGQEVLVDFLEGDPNRPVVIGRVYNGSNTHPYTLPRNKTQSGFKTQSVPSGGYNEFRFEDKQGSEEIFFRAEKDHNHQINNDHNVTIGHNHNHHVKNDHNHTVGNDYNVTIQNSWITNVVLNITETSTTKTTTAASAFDTAGTKMGAYGFSFTLAAVNIAIYGLYIQIPAVVITLAPFKCDIIGFKVDIGKFKTASRSVELEFGTLQVKKSALKAETVQAELRTLASKVEDLDLSLQITDMMVFM
jgi:type VI secretion system secreted protein VgrG